MNKSLIGKSKIPLQFRMLHTLIGFAIFFSLITIPAEAQVIRLLGIATSAEFLWWPIVFFILKLIYCVYGFAYFRHALYSIILFRAIYIVFLKVAIWLPASSFWTMQEIYTQVLGRDIFYLVESSVFLWACILLPTRVFGIKNEKHARHIFLFSLITFCLLNMSELNYKSDTSSTQLIIPLLIYGFISIFFHMLRGRIAIIEKIDSPNHIENHLFRFQLPNRLTTNDYRFKYHHLLFCSSIVFFIASKTMAAKFISIGFLTINVGGIVFSLAYLTADIMTDVYGIERTKQMIWFTIFCNLLFVFNVWVTTVLGIGDNDSFKLILHNQTRMFVASGVAFFLGMTINSTAISILKARQRNRGISLKKEFITTVWTRIATSSAFGIMIDVSLFSLIAFYDIVPTERLGSVIFFEDIYKISYEVLLAPVSILLIYLLKVKEKVDVYDELSNLNPFKINTNYKFSANRFDENYIKLKERDNG